MVYRVTHTTQYFYVDPVTLCHNVIHLRPRTTIRQTVRGSEVAIDPLPAVRQDRIDYFGNCVTTFAVQRPHKTLTVTAASTIDVPPVDITPAAQISVEAVKKQFENDRPAAIPSAYEFTFDSPLVPRSDELLRYAQPSFPSGRLLYAAVMDLTSRIHHDFTYDTTATTISTPLPEVLRHRRGVCQDFAHLMTGCLRSLGLPTRYVSGYLRTTPPPGGRRMMGADASHAWVGVWFADAGWFDFDPTNDTGVSDHHVTVAWGRDYGDVSPVKGVIHGGSRHGMSVSVDMAEVDPGG